MDQIGIRTKIKIRIETPTEDKESGLTITTTQEAEIIVEVTVTVEVTHRTQDTHKGGTINPHSLSNYNYNQDRNNHTNRIDNRRTETGSRAREVEEGKIDPKGNENLTTTASQVIDTEVKDSRNTIRDTPPRPLLARSRTITQTGQRERKLM